jgi:hypothetical protein
VTVRYQADADLKRVILLAVARQEPAVDFRSATEAGWWPSRTRRSWRLLPRPAGCS